MFYHINWFKKICTNRTWIVDCSRSFPPDSRCSSMPMSPMAMCQLLCGAGDGFNIPTLRSLLVPLRSQKTLACEIFKIIHMFLHKVLETSSLFVLKVSAFRNSKTGTHRTHRTKKPSKALKKNTCDLIKKCISVAAAFWGWVWMDVASRARNLCHPKKPWWFQRFLHVYTQDLRK